MFWGTEERIWLVQYLVYLFQKIVKERGKSSETVKYYRGQVHYLIQNLQENAQKKLHVKGYYIYEQDILNINSAEDFIYRLLGMQNTDAIKWDATISRLNSFTETMRQMECCKTDEIRLKCLKCLLRDERISRTVYNLVMEIYKLDKLDSRVKLNIQQFKAEDFIKRKGGTFGILVKDIPNKRLRESLALRDEYEEYFEGKLLYSNIIHDDNINNIDDLAMNFLRDKKNSEKLAKLGKHCKTADDVYRDLDVCAMFIFQLADIGCSIPGNRVIFNKWVDDQSLATLFNTKDNKNQILIAAGICECISKIDIQLLYEYRAEEIFKDKKLMTEIQLKAASKFLSVVANIWRDPNDDKYVENLADLVDKLFIEAAIAVPKDSTGKDYYKAKKLADMYGSESYKQFIKCLKTGSGLSKIKLKQYYEHKNEPSHDEYINILIKSRLKILYLLKIADVLHKNETINFATCL